ncbi:LysR family transcriptional regulator [Rhizobium sp. NPDC090275]|uniref:LysR family transcriptional regulator n=1 Tax=Rhizobium sp. NPDC090275 TaxID=3364498 RepID=UPI003839D10C
MDLHGIDLNLLVAFDALIAERSVTRAGIRIGRTQPAMSAALSRLRALLNDELFVRGPDGLHPTMRALELAEPIGRALTDIQRTLEFRQVFDPTQSTATFAIGLAEHPAHLILPRLVARLRQDAPGVILQIRSFVHRDDAVTLLDDGEADVTIGVPPAPAGRILSQALFAERFVCVVRNGHPQADQPMTLDTFLELSHLLVSPENDNFGLVDAALSKQGLRRRLALTVPQMYAAPALVASSDLIATLMQGVVEASGRVAELRVMDPPLDLPSVQYNMAWHRRNDVHPAQKWFRSLIASLCV